jgi:hypothetical protein
MRPPEPVITAQVIQVISLPRSPKKLNYEVEKLGTAKFALSLVKLPLI